MSVEMVIVSAFAASAVYIYIGNRLNSVMHPMRMELVDKAERLLKYSNLRDEDRAGIHGVLDRVYSYRAAWFLAIGVLVVSLIQAVRYLFGHKRSADNTPYKRELTDFVRVAVPCILANSLAATILFSVVMFLGVLCMLPVRSAARLVILAGNGPIQASHNEAGQNH